MSHHTQLATSCTHPALNLSVIAIMTDSTETMAEALDGPTLQDLIELMLKAKQQDELNLIHAAKHARNFLASANRAHPKHNHQLPKHLLIKQRESLHERETLQTLVAQGKAQPGSAILVSVDIEAGPSELEDYAPEPPSIMEMAFSAHIVGDHPSKIYSQRFVVDGQANTQRRLDRPFDKGDTELVRHQVLLSHRLTAALHAFQEEFETVVMVGWDVQGDITWLQERIGWFVPAGVTVVDVQLAIMHKHGLLWRPKLFDVLDRHEWCGVSRRSGEMPVKFQMHHAGYDAYWTLLLAYCAGEDGETVCNGKGIGGASRTESPEGNFVLRLDAIAREPWTPDTPRSANRRVVHGCYLHGKLSNGKVSQARLSKELDVGATEDLASDAATLS